MPGISEKDPESTVERALLATVQEAAHAGGGPRRTASSQAPGHTETCVAGSCRPANAKERSSSRAPAGTWQVSRDGQATPVR